MEDLDFLIAFQRDARIQELERRQNQELISGDFEGSVTGSWKKLGQSGEGLVDYQGKTYVTVPIGFVSVPAGTEVELTYAKGIYYSKY